MWCRPISLQCLPRPDISQFYCSGSYNVHVRHTSRNVGECTCCRKHVEPRNAVVPYNYVRFKLPRASCTRQALAVDGLIVEKVSWNGIDLFVRWIMCWDEMVLVIVMTTGLVMSPCFMCPGGAFGVTPYFPVEQKRALSGIPPWNFLDGPTLEGSLEPDQDFLTISDERDVMPWKQLQRSRNRTKSIDMFRRSRANSSDCPSTASLSEDLYRMASIDKNI